MVANLRFKKIVPILHHYHLILNVLMMGAASEVMDGARFFYECLIKRPYSSLTTYRLISE